MYYRFSKTTESGQKFLSLRGYKEEKENFEGNIRGTEVIAPSLTEAADLVGNHASRGVALDAVSPYDSVMAALYLISQGDAKDRSCELEHHHMVRLQDALGNLTAVFKLAGIQPSALGRLEEKTSIFNMMEIKFQSTSD